MRFSFSSIAVFGIKSVNLFLRDPLSSTPPSSDLCPLTSVLLEGFRLFLQFLMDQEAEHLCGASLRERSSRRTNYRMGWHSRKFRASIGDFPIRVPHLFYMRPRVSIVKRATRLRDKILDTLARIYASGSLAPVSGHPSLIGRGAGDEGLLQANASTLIKLLWTIELPDELHAQLTAKLTPILERWRLSGTGRQPMSIFAVPTVNCEP